MQTAVLVSGSGRSLRNLLERERAGTIATRTRLVIASRPGIGALEHAESFNVRAQVAKTTEVTAALDAAGIELVIMAGYLRQWPIPERYVGRTINIHPSLLPLFGGKGFYGHHVHTAVLESGMRVSGCTVHWVTRRYDEGPIIDQSAVPVGVEDTPDTLAARVFAAECELLPRCADAVATGGVRLVDGKTVHT